MTSEKQLLAECRTALKIAQGCLLGLLDAMPTLDTARRTVGEIGAVVDKIDAYSRLETSAGPVCDHGERLGSDCAPCAEADLRERAAGNR